MLKMHRLLSGTFAFCLTLFSSSFASPISNILFGETAQYIYDNQITSLSPGNYYNLDNYTTTLGVYSTVDSRNYSLFKYDIKTGDDWALLSISFNQESVTSSISNYSWGAIDFFVTDAANFKVLNLSNGNPDDINLRFTQWNNNSQYTNLSEGVLNTHEIYGLSWSLNTNANTLNNASGTIQVLIGNVPHSAVPSAPTSLLFLSGIVLLGFIIIRRNSIQNS